MKALSIRQPWAWMILHAGKDVEDRTWNTRTRGRVLVHAARGVTLQEWWDAWDFAFARCKVPYSKVPPYLDVERGGIVGSVEIVDCRTSSRSPWFQGAFGFVLRDPAPLPFHPCRGALGFFDVKLPYQVCRICGCHDLDCSRCIERTGEPCSWVGVDLCSACAEDRHS
jgi:hypothetical protein